MIEIAAECMPVGSVFSELMPHNAIFYITDVCIPNLFKTISRDENDDLYFEYTTSFNGIFDIQTVRIVGSITMPPGNYTELAFSQALDQQLNTITYGAIRAQYDSNNNICGIYTNGDNTAFRILTDEEVQQSYNNSGNTINEIINNVITPSPTYTKASGMTINRLRLQPVHNIYISLLLT